MQPRLTRVPPGRRAEREALRYLRSRGLELLERNFHCRFGEIDLIMQDSACLVFVEVRMRTANRFAHAADSVDKHKQRRILLAAQSFLQKHPGLATSACRFDVIGIDRDARGFVNGGPGRIDWRRDAFRPE